MFLKCFCLPIPIDHLPDLSDMTDSMWDSKKQNTTWSTSHMSPHLCRQNNNNNNKNNKKHITTKIQPRTHTMVTRSQSKHAQ